MRTFHIGGVASASAEESSLIAKYGGVVKFEDLRIVKDRNNKNVVLNRNGNLLLQDETGRTLERYNITYGTRILVEEGQIVKAGDMLAEWDPYSAVILSDVEGTIAFGDIVEGETMKEDIDPTTGLSQRIIVSMTHEKRQPRISIKDEENKTIQRYILPVGAMILVDEGSKIFPGDILAKIPRETQKQKI